MLCFFLSLIRSDCIYHFHGSMGNIDTVITHAALLQQKFKYHIRVSARASVVLVYFCMCSTTIEFCYQKTKADRNLQRDCVVFSTGYRWPSQLQLKHIPDNIKYFTKISDSFYNDSRMSVLFTILFACFDLRFFLLLFSHSLKKVHWNAKRRNPVIQCVCARRFSR